MKRIAFIPLRFGSKGILNKNIKKILGRPLFTWVLNEAIHSSLDHVFIFTNDKRVIDFIKNEYSWTEKLTVLERSEESATETASTDFAMLEFAEKIQFDFDIIVLLQATSPLTTKDDINKACNQIENKKADSVLSVVKTHRFIWSKKGESLNYDYRKRPRRQDFEGLFIENGAIYASTRKNLISNKNRIGGRIELLEMSPETLVEIDEPIDLIIVEKLIENRLLRNKKQKPIKAFFLDVDGVFTNGKVSVSSEGEVYKDFSLIDGMGLELLQEEGIIPVVITSEISPIVTKRMEKLKIQHTYCGIKDKYAFLDYFLLKNNLSRDETAYIGDDINDLANICSAGISFCPKNATEKIRMTADLVLHNNGSEGAIREACEYLIKYNKKN